MQLHKILLLLLPVLAGCNFSSDKPGNQKEANNNAISLNMTTPALSEHGVAADVKYMDSGNGAEETIPEKIIRTADVRAQVGDIKEARKKIEGEVKFLKGYFSNESENNNPHNYELTLTIRIPNASFDKMVESSIENALFVDFKNISAQDVTAEYIDIAARLKTKKEVHSRYLELLKKAAKVTDIIEVEEKLRVLQEEIESTEKRLKYINDKVQYSTIELTIYQLKTETSMPKLNFFSRLATSVNRGYEGFQEFIIWIFGQWIWLLIFITAIVFLRRRMRRKV